MHINNFILHNILKHKSGFKIFLQINKKDFLNFTNKLLEFLWVKIFKTKNNKVFVKYHKMKISERVNSFNSLKCK